ncbi:MAG: hypothetical protein R3F04_13225 [Lysobacteraceae bacterium]
MNSSATDAQRDIPLIRPMCGHGIEKIGEASRRARINHIALASY